MSRRAMPKSANRAKDALRGELLLLKCAKRLEQLSARRFRDAHGSSLSRFDVLANLEKSPGNRLATSELARRLIASQGNISRLLDRMEHDGLVARHTGSADRRVSEIALTAAGARMFRDMAVDHERWMAEVFDTLDDAEAAQLIELLMKVRARIDAALADP